MLILSRLLDPAASEAAALRRQAEDDRFSLACIGGVSATGLALGLVAVFGPAGSDVAVATGLAAVLGGAGTVGFGFALAVMLWR
ncbi:hypothetical protein [Inquilinus sp.]|uniref:hypothetical protein n=1 Tax=Inquilinus sp. TaxID=1932117 RepID=UPI0031E35EB3